MAHDPFHDSREAVRQQVLASPLLQCHVDRFIELAMPAIQLEPGELVDDGPAGSRLGGRPWLPAGMEWPRWDGYDKRPWVDRWGREHVARVEGGPLALMAQIDLAALPALPGEDWPNSGKLLFFYDARSQPWGFEPRDRNASRVIWLPADDEACALAEWPDDLDAAQRFPTTAAEQACTITLANDFHSYGLDAEDEWEALNDLCGEHAGGGHWLGGRPFVIQGDMQLKCQLVSNGLYCGDPDTMSHPRYEELSAGAEDWILLLQLASSNAMQWQFGDMGCIYFWIRQQDLRARDFSGVWTVLQCY